MMFMNSEVCYSPDVCWRQPLRRASLQMMAGISVRLCQFRDQMFYLLLQLGTDRCRKQTSRHSVLYRATTKVGEPSRT